MGQYFGYLDWLTPTDLTTAEAEIVGSLELRMELVALITDPNHSKIRVNVYAEIDGSTADLPSGDFGRDLYDASEEKPTRKALASQLEQRLLELFDAPEPKRFIDDTMAKYLQERFLSFVTIARDLIPVELSERLLLPFTERDLRAANGSVLNAELQAHLPDKPNPENGILDLEKQGTSNAPGFAGRVETGVTRFSFGPVLQSSWHPLIPAAVRDYRVPESLRVHMIRYIPNPYGGDSAATQTLRAQHQERSCP